MSRRRAGNQSPDSSFLVSFCWLLRSQAGEVVEGEERLVVTRISIHYKQQEGDVLWLVRVEDHQVLETCWSTGPDVSSDKDRRWKLTDAVQFHFTIWNPLLPM